MANTKISGQIASSRIAHERLLGAIAAWRAAPSRELRDKLDEAAIAFEDHMLALFNPDQPFPKKRGRPPVRPLDAEEAMP
jgi:hypothetical protein